MLKKYERVDLMFRQELTTKLPDNINLDQVALSHFVAGLQNVLTKLNKIDAFGNISSKEMHCKAINIDGF